VNRMPELVQSALSALRHLQPANPTAAIAILSLWAHAAAIDVDQVVNYYFTGGRTDVTVVADGRLVSHCCGRVDDDPHRSFCEHYRPADADERLASNTDFRDGYVDGYLDAIKAARGMRDEQRLAALSPAERFLDETAARWERERQEWLAKISGCPAWCTLTHDPEDDARDGMALHMDDDHTDETVRKLIDARALEVRVTRLDVLSEGRIGTPALFVRVDAELTTWRQAAELTRIILDAFDHVPDSSAA
jgi:hypothetical protein